MILSPEAVCQLAPELGQRYNISFTNGCFDLLHFGHVYSLKEAKKYEHNNLLIVALNTDESVARLKGPARPVWPLNVRLQYLDLLGLADILTWFGTEADKDLPIALIERIRPRYHFKGEDYRDKHIPEAEAVRNGNGTIVLLPLVTGISVTNILERISKS